MRARCPECDEEVGGHDVAVATGRAICRPPGGLLADAQRAHAPRAGEPPPDLRWRELVDGSGRRFEIGPGRLAALPWLGFAALWNAALFAQLAKLASAQSHGSAGGGLRFPLWHVVAGVVVTWIGLSRLVNHRFIRIDRESLRVGTHPLPGWSQREPTSQIERFEAGVALPLLVWNAWGNDARPPVVKVITRDNRSVALRLPLGTTYEAQFVAWRLNVTLTKLRRRSAYRR